MQGIADEDKNIEDKRVQNIMVSIFIQHNFGSPALLRSLLQPMARNISKLHIQEFI